MELTNVHDSKLLIPHTKHIKRFVDKPKVMITDSAWDVKKLYSTLAKDNLALYVATNVRCDKNKRKIKPANRWRIEQIFGVQQ